MGGANTCCLPLSLTQTIHIQGKFSCVRQFCVNFLYIRGFIIPLPVSIYVWSILYTFSAKMIYHSIEFTSPHMFEPVCMTKPFNKRMADCIISSDKCPTIPCLCQDIISISSQCPNLRTVIGTINSSRHITSSSLLGLSIRLRKFRNLVIWIKLLDFLTPGH